MSRFERQVILGSFGEASQESLLAARVLVVGAGGLGCPVLLYLAAAGIGNIIIADGDTVSESNLNRQVVFGFSDIGKPKAATCAAYFNQKYPDIRVTYENNFITPKNASLFVSNCDLVIDGTDNFSTRYLLSDICYLLQKPLISGSIYKFEGQVIVLGGKVFNTRALSYRDLYPNPPAPEEVPNCSETGVLGVLPGIIGTLMASEAIKLITEYTPPMFNKVLFFNLLQNTTYEIALAENPEALAKTPQSLAEFETIDYTIACGLAICISWEEALQLKQQKRNATLIDVRDASEQPKLAEQHYLSIPLPEVATRAGELAAAEIICVFCQAGARSQKAAKILQAFYPNKTVVSIEGGINRLYSNN